MQQRKRGPRVFAPSIALRDIGFDLVVKMAARVDPAGVTYGLMIGDVADHL